MKKQFTEKKIQMTQVYKLKIFHFTNKENC